MIRRKKRSIVCESSWWFTLLVVSLSVLGCGEGPNDDSPIIVPELSAHTIPFDAFARLPQRLHHGLRMRKSHVDHITIEDVFATQFESEELVDLLERWQPYIANLIEASKRLEPPLPAEPKYTDAEISQDAHLDGITARMINNSRLLVADAIRCWSIEDYDGCAVRFEAGLRLGLCMYRDEEPMHRRNGNLLLMAVFIELELRVNKDLRDKIGHERIDEFLNTLRRLEEVHDRLYTDSNTGTRVLSHLIEVFSQEGE